MALYRNAKQKSKRLHMYRSRKSQIWQSRPLPWLQTPDILWFPGKVDIFNVLGFTPKSCVVVQRCRWVFKSGWAGSDVVGIICASGCNRINWTPTRLRHYYSIFSLSIPCKLYTNWIDCNVVLEWIMACNIRNFKIYNLGLVCIRIHRINWVKTPHRKLMGTQSRKDLVFSGVGQCFGS